MGRKFFFLILAGAVTLEMHGANLQSSGKHDGEQSSTVGRPQSRPNQKLTVRVYNYAEIEPKMLERTRREASRVLATAGIELRWERCRTSERETSQDASCSQRAGAHVIQLRIHPREMAKKLTSRSTEFGYSIPLENGFGIIAGVYLDRTSEMAQSLGFDLHVVLGHTIAHEIGHLLLGTNSHAKVGVMRPTWGDREVRLANTGLLVFTEAQANLMQDQIARRFASAETGPSRINSGASPGPSAGTINRIE